jgi:hypothetical protein
MSTWESPCGDYVYPIVRFDKNRQLHQMHREPFRVRIRVGGFQLPDSERIKDMPTITTKDGVEIFYKDWGAGQPIVFSHGWPLSADDWDAQMMFFLGKGFRVIERDRP